jgi:uncharacterized protein with ParB-like and HNH nuclease domain
MNDINLFYSDITVSSSQTTIGHYAHLHSEGELFLNAPYQREYVWTASEQQALLDSVFAGVPMGGIAVVINDGSVGQYCEVVDGKQRLTTLMKFMDGEFAYLTHDGQKVYFNEMSAQSKRMFKSVHLPQYVLKGKNSRKISEGEKLNYFFRINFGGVPQDNAHREKIMQMMSME